MKPHSGGTRNDALSAIPAVTVVHKRMVLILQQLADHAEPAFQRGADVIAIFDDQHDEDQHQPERDRPQRELDILEPLVVFGERLLQRCEQGPMITVRHVRPRSSRYLRSRCQAPSHSAGGGLVLKPWMRCIRASAGPSSGAAVRAAAKAVSASSQCRARYAASPSAYRLRISLCAGVSSFLRPMIS